MTGTIVYSSPYVPAEWIAAHGLRPSRLLPGASDRDGPFDLREGLCPYARQFLNGACALADVDGIVLTTVCDQMRRAYDWISMTRDTPLFLMNVPSTWQTPEACGLYLSEIRRLGSFLTGLGGTAPSTGDLLKTMRAVDSRRAALRESKDRLSPRGFSEAIAAFHRNGNAEPRKPARHRPRKGVPIALLGGPLVEQSFDIFDIIRDSGGHVVLDGTETGERTMPARFDRRRMQEDPLLELVDAYFGAIPDPSQRPNSPFFNWLKREIAAYGIRGVILIRHTWCDTWHAEVGRLKEWLDPPMLDLDVGEGAPSTLWTNRVQAFMEALHG